MADNSKNLIKVYSKLGIKYLDDIENYCPKEIFDFMDMLPKNSRVLEIGCAGGRDAKIFINHGYTYTGIDLVQKFIIEARRRVPKGHFKKMSILELKFPDRYFDAIWANAVLLHLDKKDVPKSINNMYRVLKPKGKIHIRVKKGSETANIKEKLSAGQSRLFTFFHKKELERYVKAGGFKIILSKILPDDLGRDIKWISVWGEKI
ncbi:MAG: class I SAM-dependent methyltransferase [Patescibacteria group bacterium]|jgi:ubiquinone/menaquinone biosynthesis C-methylase UbiE